MVIKKGVYGVIILMILLILISSLASANLLDWIKKTITGRASTTQQTNVSISVVGVNQVSIEVWNDTLAVAATTPTEYNSVTIDINVTVTDPDGYADINVSSVSAYLINDTSAAPIRGNNTCADVSQNTVNSKNFTCSVDMWYWDIAGAWIINISANDLGNTTYISNESTVLSYTQLQAIQIAPESLTWPAVAPGNENQSSDNDPTIVNNTGNYNITSGNFKITGINLYGASGAFINVANFSVNITSAQECDTSPATATLLANGTAQAIDGAVLDFGNLSDGSAQTNIYYCLVKVPDNVISEAYSTTEAGSDAWVVSIALALFAIKKRKQKNNKKLGKTNLLKKTGIMLGLTLFMITLLTSFSLAFGVSSSNWKGNPLIVYPGYQQTVSPIMLQNMVGTDDVTVRARIINGSEIASLEKIEFTVKAGTKDTTVPIKLNIPEDAVAGTTYPITISFATVTTGETGVVLGTGMDTSFDVLIGGTPPEEKAGIKPLTIYILIAAIILLIIIITLVLKKRSSQKRR